MNTPIRLTAPHVCSCGEEHYLVPANAKESFEDRFSGYYWNCSCKSTLFLPRDMVSGEEVCDCDTCSDAEDDDRCSFDCDLEEPCRGCSDAIEDEKDREFEWKKATGRI